MFMLICHVDLLCLSDKLSANAHLVTATDVLQAVRLAGWLGGSSQRWLLAQYFTSRSVVAG